MADDHDVTYLMGLLSRRWQLHFITDHVRISTREGNVFGHVCPSIHGKGEGVVYIRTLTVDPPHPPYKDLLT